MANNEIGTQTFIDLQGNAPTSIQQRAEAIERAGVDGTGVMYVGDSGRAFRLRSFRDVDTLADAHTLAETYAALVGGPNLSLKIGGVTKSYQVAVLHVDPIVHEKIESAVGGFSTTKGALLIADWILQPMTT